MEIFAKWRQRGKRDKKSSQLNDNVILHNNRESTKKKRKENKFLKFVAQIQGFKM